MNLTDTRLIRLKEIFMMMPKTRGPLLLTLAMALTAGNSQAQDFFDDLFGPAGNGNGTTVVPAPAPAPAAPAAAEEMPEDMPQIPARPDLAPDDVTPELRGEDARIVAQQERFRVETRVREGRRNLADGRRAMQNGQWAVAIDFFDEALSRFRDVEDLQDVRAETNRLKSEAFFQMARAIYDRRREGGDLDRAREFLDRSLAANAQNANVPVLRAEIDRFEQRVTEGREERRIQDEEQYRTAREQIERLLTRGRKELEIRDFDAAENTFERVLAIDRHNIEALRFLRRVAEQRWEARRVERETSVMRQMAMGEERWLMPMRVDQRGPQVIDGTGPTGVVDRITVDLENRLAQIMIPEIRFQRANITDVISFLVAASREQDRDGIGVNIIYMDPDLADGGDAPAPAPAGGDFGFGFGAPTPAPAAPRQQGIRPINLEVRNISLLDALKLVTEQANLYYRVERNIVIIDRRGRGRLITRFYPVDPARFTTVAGTLSAPRRIGGGGGGAPDPFADPFGAPPAAGGGGAGDPDLRALFERFGVQIPENGDIAFEPSIAQLVVTLTPDLFPQFEEVLSKINVSPRQVEIEARFVEVLQRDLEQVGFEWILNDDAELLVQRGLGAVNNRPRIVADQNPAGITSGLRFFNFDPVANATTPQSRTGTGSRFNPLGDVLSLRGVLTNPELQMVVHAIDQRGNSDLLSAPRVTTINGVNAIIEVVNEIIYPTEFDVTQNDIQVQGGGGTDATGAPVFIPPTVIPGGFEVRQVGVILNVTPTVSADNYTINLTMLPEIAELVDWIQYGTQVPIGDQVFTVNMPQPVFASRNVTTSMIVWDGHTVVMGGLIREDLVRYKDKIPLLGDIPLLGRLFRSEGTRSEKRNLLIFVTARLVDPAGNSVNAATRQDLVTQGAGIRAAGGAMNP